MTTRQKLDIQKEAICLSLKLGMLRTRRKVTTSSIETDADPEMVHVSKDIMESEELKAIGQFQGEIKRYVTARCLPSPFRSGVYLLRLLLIEEVMKELELFEKKYKSLVQTFLEFYAQVYAQRHDLNSPLRERLGSLYHPEDYPHPQKVEQAFYFEVQLWELATPGALRTIDRALYEREAAKMENVWVKAQEQITQVLLTEFKEMTARMADRLTPGPDGKPKVFRDTLVGNLQEWLDLFDKRDLAKDDQLIGFVKDARRMINGIKPEMLRESEDLRKGIAQEMQNITAKLDQAIIDRPGRMIDLDEAVEVA